MYFGIRNGKFGWYEEEWEGVESKDNKDIVKYEGEIKNGFPNGQGTHTKPDGEKYVGEWKDGKRDSKGTYTWSDGTKYVGEHKDGKKHGQGTHTYSDGRKYVGKWKNGQLWNGRYLDKNGKITKKFVNGKRIKQ